MHLSLFSFAVVPANSSRKLIESKTVLHDKTDPGYFPMKRLCGYKGCGTYTMELT